MPWSGLAQPLPLTWHIATAGPSSHAPLKAPELKRLSEMLKERGAATSIALAPREALDLGPMDEAGPRDLILVNRFAIPGCRGP